MAVADELRLAKQQQQQQEQQQQPGELPGEEDGRPAARFPGYDVMRESDTWDDETKAVVMARLGPPAKLAFFTAGEEPTARALVTRLLALDRDPEPVAVLEMIDARLLARDGDGYRYADMPEDPEAFRQSVAGLDADARETHGRPFSDLGRAEQIDLLEHVQQASGEWHGMPAKRVFSLWTRYVCGAFYSHPAAWNEMGFGGPAYPRGYKNLNGRENWEVREVDAEDPVPWVDRVESARTRHAGLGGDS